MPIAGEHGGHDGQRPGQRAHEAVEKDVLARLLGHRAELHDRQVRIVPREHLLDGRAQLARRELAAQVETRLAEERGLLRAA